MRELCWNITTRCNQSCGYCLRFADMPDLCRQDIFKILENLAKCGVKNLTWGGGEPMMYPHITSLLKESYEFGIKNTLVSNGVLLKNGDVDKVVKYLDTLTLSLDSVRSETNKLIGRGENHFDNINNIIKQISHNKTLKLKINSVACSYNKSEFIEMLSYIDGRVDFWRVFRMMPIRERAILNYNDFSIEKECFDKIKSDILASNKLCKVDFRETVDMEKKYILLVANGDILCTENGRDIKKGNALNLEILRAALSFEGR